MSETIILTEDQAGSKELKTLQIKLAKPEKANAFDSHLIHELTETFQSINLRKDVRMVVMSAQGKHFCAGADVNWMKASKDLTYEKNKDEAFKLQQMFTAIASCPFPLIACVQGSVFGGGVGIVACADIVIAQDSCKFALSEAKLGLIPAVIMPFVAKKIPRSHLMELALTARIFLAQEAASFGLVHALAKDESETDELLEKWKNFIHLGGPHAQQEIKHLIDRLEKEPLEEKRQLLTRETIAKVRVSKEAQEGLSAFLEKRKPDFV